VLVLLHFHACRVVKCGSLVAVCWTGDHLVMEKASTDIVLDEDIYFFIEYSDTHVSNCVKICNVSQ